jgi:hypothetical protein
MCKKKYYIEYGSGIRSSPVEGLTKKEAIKAVKRMKDKGIWKTADTAINKGFGTYGRIAKRRKR